MVDLCFNKKPHVFPNSTDLHTVRCLTIIKAEFTITTLGTVLV